MYIILSDKYICTKTHLKKILVREIHESNYQLILVLSYLLPRTDTLAALNENYAGKQHFLVLVKIGRICNKVSRPLFQKFQTVLYRSRTNYLLCPIIRNRLLPSNYFQWLLSLSIEQKNSIMKGSLFSVLFAIILLFSIKQLLAIVVFHIKYRKNSVLDAAFFGHYNSFVFPLHRLYCFKILIKSKLRKNLKIRRKQ